VVKIDVRVVKNDAKRRKNIRRLRRTGTGLPVDIASEILAT
jgi:hypothetical protein